MRRTLTRAVIGTATTAAITHGIIQATQTIVWWWQILTTTPWGWL